MTASQVLGYVIATVCSAVLIGLIAWAAIKAERYFQDRGV